MRSVYLQKMILNYWKDEKIRLENKNIVLTQLDEIDIELIHSFTSDYSNLTPFFSTNIRSAEYWRNRYREDGLWNENYGMLKIIDKTDDEIAGITWFFKPPSQHSQLEGYEIAFNMFRPSKRDKRFSGQVLKMVSSYLFATYPVARIQSTTMLDANDSTIDRVAKASGFYYEGTMRKANFVRGKHIDVQLFSLLREESIPLDDLITDTQ